MSTPTYAALSTQAERMETFQTEASPFRYYEPWAADASAAEASRIMSSAEPVGMAYPYLSTQFCPAWNLPDDMAEALAEALAAFCAEGC